MLFEVLVHQFLLRGMVWCGHAPNRLCGVVWCGILQAVFQERNPLVVVPGPDGNTLVPRDQLEDDFF